ncbi:hypothetical protein EJV47_09855 [Hymenobacter gummosus]|uniref:UDP-N-acetylglucosamine kinase n=1 Tax=Hymenobacter gummosus TaxID=1776032 RepID=A0A3S0IPU3_9BACT|nr:AAA family ATPase [Hymenobacter gummosus]RTQ50908.1 hypothetical protein EJV47_09855 [Hymenobacter gummosus]
MSATVPTVYVLAGPNGVGKTSIYWYEAADVPRLNGDALYQQGVDALTIEATLRQQQEEWVAQCTSFVIETNAATERDYSLFQSLRQAGYRVELRFVCLESVALCRERVAQRVREGGHDIPAALVAQRYANSLSLLKLHYRAFDRLQLYDNTALPREVLEFVPGQVPTAVADLPAWAAPVLAHITRMERVYGRLG